VLDFGFRCHPPSIQDGLSIPLLSVTLACLMAIFRDRQLSPLVSENSLTLLIKQAANGLLDSRLSSSTMQSNLDDSTCQQLVKAINKLAIQAAGEASRHISLRSLMSIQLQLCESVANSSFDVPNLNSRTSRIMTKLFARVIKAEEQLSDSYFRTSVDVNSILSCMTIDFFEGESYEGGGSFVPCQNMGRVLILSMVKAAQKQQCFSELLSIMKNDSSRRNENKNNFMELFYSCCSEIGVDLSEVQPHEELSSYNSQKDTNIYDHSTITRDMLPSLVSAVGEATDNDSKRSKAIANLATYVSKYGEDDLICHLESVSVPFKHYILSQLKVLKNKHDFEDSDRSNTTTTTNINNTPTHHENSNISMSEKLRYLKSKLNATEAAVHSAFYSNSDSMTATPNSRSSKNRDSVGHYYSAADSTHSESTGTISSIREKLANANQQRALRRAGGGSSTKNLSSSTASTAPPPMDKSISSSTNASTATSAYSSAAALRARLQEVKRNKYTT
jgi:hypothetical protein